MTVSPVLNRDYARLLAAVEDDPLSEEELARVREGEAGLAASDYVTLEELRRGLELDGPQS